MKLRKTLSVKTIKTILNLNLIAMITPIFWIIPVASILALVFACFFFRQMMKESEGTELMAKIAQHVRKGAMSYLKQQ